MQSTKSVTGPIYCCQVSLPSVSYYSWGVCLQCTREHKQKKHPIFHVQVSMFAYETLSVFL